MVKLKFTQDSKIACFHFFMSRPWSFIARSQCDYGTTDWAFPEESCEVVRNEG